MMMSWSVRSPEERSLLNPSFCAALLWHSASGYASERDSALPIDLSFLVLPLVLHRETREMLPRSTTTSLAAWLTEAPLVRVRIGERAASLGPFTKEAMLFGGMHGFLALGVDGVRANSTFKKHVTTALKASSDEVRTCAKRAEFLGKWFEKAGRSETVMALLGVRP
ncbi:three component ABC system middle component [Sorangium sp. So ce590]|uniref:three component ABC system middle component n=1 Tax=Sorangium sp. So ce590 TaxID=3133317 RepID=UPI003F5F28B4